MRRFDFRLEPVRRYRAGREKEKKREFREASAAYARESAALRALMAEEKRQKDRIRRELSVTCDPVRVKAGGARLENLYRLIEEQEARVEEARIAMEEKRAELVEASKERKVMERLRERRLEEYLYELGREEQGFLDEVAGGRYVLRRLKAEEG